MQIPKRKPGKYTFFTYDPNITEEKYLELKNHLLKLKTISQPQAIKDVKRFAENGDFSENAEYQIAKGRLRGINNKILELGEQIKNAIIIKPSIDTSIVKLGHKVTIESNNKKISYQILGSNQTNPQAGIISNSSPLGSALIGKKVGDNIKIKTPNSEIIYTLLKIE